MYPMSGETLKLGSDMMIARKPGLALAAICALAMAPAAAAQQGAKVTVTVNKVMSDMGTVRAALCAEPAIFGTGPCAAASATAPAKAGSVELTFTDVKPGTYALGIFHDEDGNGELNIFAEPMAFGNGATALPPTFEGASLKIAGDLKTETALFRMGQ
jgi:uncharacterized protein (DUF2141 family)